MKKWGNDFFQMLVGLENTREILVQFDQIIARAVPISLPEFSARLYRSLIDNLLLWLNIPTRTGSSSREWSPLYRFADKVDPYYFTEGQIKKQLAQCPATMAEQREIIVNVLSGYFLHRKEGFPADFPSPLVNPVESRSWSGLFPPDYEWPSLEILQEAGLYPLGSYAGFRSSQRFLEGKFNPGQGRGGLKKWADFCQRASERPEIIEGKSAAHRLDFLAAVFAGEFATMGYAGFCGEIPRCSPCPLNNQCRWAKAPGKESREVTGVKGRLLQNRAAYLTTSQLLQGLLELEGGEQRKLLEKLEKITLRKLAVKSSSELEDWLEDIPIGRDQMLALFELCKRYSEERLSPGIPMHSAHVVFKHFRIRLRDFKQEQFLVLLLDVKRRYLGEILISQGTLNQSPVHPREVFNGAIREHAAFVIVVHNHPSGDPTPSKDDILVTKQLVEAGGVIGIPVLDHIIIADESYVSFTEKGMM